MLPVITAVMRPVRQSVVIADQVAMKFNRLLNATASFPVKFAESSLNAELALNGVITNDKFCLTRLLRLVLTRPRRSPTPLALAAAGAIPSTPDEVSHLGGPNEKRVEAAPGASGAA